MGDLLSVKEVAEIASVTTQAIYQRLKKDLEPYVHYENGKKVLDSEVLKVLNKEEFAKATQDIDNTAELLETTIHTLMEQLSAKDEQIATFQREVVKQNEHARVQSDKLIALVEQVNDLQKNNQILLKTEQDRAMYTAQEKKDARPRGWFERLFRGSRDAD